MPLNQDFFVGFGKTVLKPEEVVVSVFIPFSRKVKMAAAAAERSGADPSGPSGGGGSSFPPRPQEGGLFPDRDHRDESALLGGVQGG